MDNKRWINIFVAFENEIFAGLVSFAHNIASVVSFTSLTEFTPTPDGFINRIDHILSDFYQQTNIETDEAIFVISQDWLISNQLTPSRKKFLTQAKKDLDLKINGFVVLEEAVTFALKNANPPVESFLFLSILNHSVHLTQIELGRITQHVSVTKSQNLTEDIAELISRLKTQVRPLHLLVFTPEPKKITSLLDQINWQEELGFVHPPNLTYWSAKDLFQNLIQIILGEAYKNPITVNFTSSQSQTSIPSSSLSDPSSLPSSTSPPDTKPGQKTTVSDSSLSQPPPDPPPPTVSTPSPSSSTPAVSDLSDAGVILNPAPQSDSSPTLSPPTTPKLNLPKPNLSFSGFNLNFIKSFSLPKLNFKNLNLVPKLKPLFNFLPFFGFRFIPLLLPFFLIPAALAFVYYSFFKTDIIIIPKTESLTRTIPVTLDPDVDQINLDTKIIPARRLVFTIDKKASLATSGTTETGEPATGQITIFNKTNKPKTFKKGTILYLADQPTKKLTLLQDIKVASQSVQITDDEVTTLIPGKATVQAQTNFFGEEANLKTGTTLYFDKLDTKVYKAKVTQDFSGGKKYEVRAVSKDDIQRLKEKIQQDIKNNINQLIANKIQPDEQIVKSSIQTDYIKEQFSAQLNQPADSLTLEATAKITVLVYSQQAIKQLIDQALADIIPPGFLVDKTQLKWQFLPVDGNKYQLKLNIPLKLSLDTQVIKDNLSGKDKNTAAFYLTNLPGVYAFKITFIPPVPSFLQRIPYNKSNINIKIQNQF